MFRKFRNTTWRNSSADRKIIRNLVLLILIAYLLKEYGEETAFNFINNIQFITRGWLLYHGFSISISDCIATKTEQINQVINRFPNSEYAKDSYQKIILVKSNIAAKHMSIGRFYHKSKKYTAALNRYKIVVEDFSETKFTPEALYRISEIYYSIGMTEQSIKTAAISHSSITLRVLTLL